MPAIMPRAVVITAGLLVSTTYRQLVDEARRELACKLLIEREPVQAVAERVGFRSVSAFQKGFQRWLNLSPSEFRRAAMR